MNTNTFGTFFSYADHPTGFGYVVTKIIRSKNKRDVVEPVSGRIFSEQAAINQADFMDRMAKVPAYEDRTAADRVVEFFQTTASNELALMAGLAAGATTLLAMAI